MHFINGHFHFRIQLENIYPRVDEARWGDWWLWKLLGCYQHPPSTSCWCSPIPCSAWRPARASRRRWRASNLLNQHPSLLPVNLVGGKDTPWPLGGRSLSWEGLAGESSGRQAGWRDGTRQPWVTQAPVPVPHITAVLSCIKWAVNFAHFGWQLL